MPIQPSGSDSDDGTGSEKCSSIWNTGYGVRGDGIRQRTDKKTGRDGCGHLICCPGTDISNQKRIQKYNGKRIIKNKIAHSQMRWAILLVKVTKGFLESSHTRNRQKTISKRLSKLLSTEERMEEPYLKQL